MPEERSTVLLLDDDKSSSESVKQAFESARSKWRLVHVDSLQDALTCIVKPDVVLILATVHPPDGDISDLLAACKNRPAIVLIEPGDEPRGMECVRAGAIGYVLKAEKSLIELPRMIEHLLRDWREEGQILRDDDILRQSERMYRCMIEESFDLICTYSLDGVITYAGPQVQRYGFTPDEVLGHSVFEYIYEEDINVVSDDLKRTVETGEEFPSEFRLIDRAGNPHWVEEVGRIIRHKDRDQEIAGRIRDIDDRKKAELKLLQSRESYRELINSVQEGIGLVDENEVILFCNPAFGRMFEVDSLDEIIGSNLLEFIHPHERDLVEAQTGLRKKGAVSQYELSIVTAKGNEKTILATISPRFDKESNFIGAFGGVLDITDRKMAEEQLRNSEERHRSLVDHIGVGILQLNRQMEIVSTNRQMQKWLPSIDLSQPPTCYSIRSDSPGREACKRCPARATLDDGLVHEAVLRHCVCSDERDFRVVASPLKNNAGRVTSVIVMLEDITDKLKLDRDLSRAAKLKSVGILAGGIAHDFNNILTAILGNISLAKMEIDSASNSFGTLSEAEKATLRAQDLTKQLLTFSKGGTPIREVASMEDIIMDTAGFALAGSNVGCRFSFQDDLQSVNVDVGQISQVVNNLLINADQAMPGSGYIDISVENCRVTESDPVTIDDGEYVRVIVRDHGVGIPHEIMKKIFDPFFTTKETGSGLGLAAAYTIVRNHDGHIEVESEVGAGTAFTIYLPATGQRANAKPADSNSPALGRGRILVMDDERIVRDLVATTLRRLGYEVCTTSDGSEALQLHREATTGGEPFDAVIFDLTVPGSMGGKDAMQKIRETDSSVKAIVTSGYSSDQVLSCYREHGFDDYIPKPFDARTLGEKVRAVLQETEEVS